MVRLEEVHKNPLVNMFIKMGNNHLGELGYTDHGYLHVHLVSRLAREIMLKLGYGERLAELAGISGYMHDIGNVISRNSHSLGGALMAMEILRRMNMDPIERTAVCAAIGNHDEGIGQPVNEVAAALILADKSHVHRNRVRNRDVANFDIHDRVNYAAKYSILDINEEERVITMDVNIDTDICPVMEYFEIFLGRMLLCRRAASFLDCQFELVINGAKLL